MSNRLVAESSPYLLQHADNPVDWYPWGEEALQKAKAEDKPIFLSIGYSACHWCHVMAHESFEDERVAAILNERFISVKVDREERPDLDRIYMSAVQALTGSGGWPMSVFLTPQGQPFYGGTYFPPEPRYGMPSFSDVLLAVADAWRNRRQELVEGGQNLVTAIERQMDVAQDMKREGLERDTLDGAFGNTPPGILRRYTWSPRRWRPWPGVACTTNSAAGSTATPSTITGWSPTSRRCSTTTPSWPACTCMPGRWRVSRSTARSPRRRSTTSCAR
jgi:hypothetical protein